MHNFLAAFFALIFSFCHAQSIQHSQAFAAPPGSSVAVAGLDPVGEFVPSRRELAQSQASRGYAEAACASCSAHRMNASYIVR